MGKLVTSEIDSSALLTVIDQRRDKFSLGPLRLCVELFGKLVPSALIRDGDLCEVVVKDSSMEVNYELESKVTIHSNDL